MASKKVAWDYIVPVKLPADLKGVEPGKLNALLLRPVPGGGKMHWIAACAWSAMVEKAKAEGLELKPTSSGDTYRSYDSQKAGFLIRYQLKPIKGSSTKTFEGKTWYLKKGMAMLATPGKSQHNLGLAVDVHTAGEPKRLNWLIANVKEFGFSWEVVPSEPWHLRYVCGNEIPASVKAWMDANGVTAPQPGAAPVINPSVATPVAGNNATPRDYPRRLQQALKDKGFYRSKVDGDIGPKTREAIKAFKISNGLNDDFIVGRRVRKLLGL